MISEQLTLGTGDDLSLEAVFDSPGLPRAVLLLCHPHPRMGGTMNAPLLLALRDELVSRQWAVLRFNFRGIGRSQGESTDGRAETADVRAGLEWLRRRFPELPIALAGWSFGAAVAVRVACEEDGLTACLAIAPPPAAKAEISAGLPGTNTCNISCPLLVLVGANDDQVSPAECRRWAEGVTNARYVEMAGANHFFWAKYDKVASTVTEFLDEALEKET